ncbi:MAG: hypothetical protein IPK99_03070 [Flavobacteriales bacterium]|nr:hypothetical protein [Flavobacteriales bacterium]
MLLLSANGTLRTILVLLIIWLVLRMVLRFQKERQRPGMHRAERDGRSPGEVRIEHPDGNTRSHGGGNVIDVDHEEIR